MKRLLTILAVLSAAAVLNAQEYRLNEKGYFNYEGIDAMAFDDFYPEGHQGGGSSHYMFLVLASMDLLK